MATRVPDHLNSIIQELSEKMLRAAAWEITQETIENMESEEKDVCLLVMARLAQGELTPWFSHVDTLHVLCAVDSARKRKKKETPL